MVDIPDPDAVALADIRGYALEDRSFRPLCIEGRETPSGLAKPRIRGHLNRASPRCWLTVVA